MKKQEVQRQKRLFGKRMNQLRKKDKKNIKTFAYLEAVTGIKDSNLCQIGKGNMNIEYETMLIIIEALDSTVGEFFSDKMFFKQAR